MRTGISHRHENSKDREATLGGEDTVDRGEKRGKGVFDFRSEKEWTIYRWLRKSGTHMAGKLLLGDSDRKGDPGAT